MAKYTPSSDISIPSLQKKAAEQLPIMQPGYGTPWEDRGSQGVVGAFFKTGVMALSAPQQLFQLIRRPDSKHDVRGYVVGSSIFWGLGATILLLTLRVKNGPDWEPEGFHLMLAMTFVYFTALAWALHLVASMILAKLISIESTARAPSVLVFNVVGYSMGPSFLAVVPVIGLPIAGIWIAGLMVYGSLTRLRLKSGPAIVNALLTALICAVATGAAFYVGRMLFHGMMSYFT